ncbi:hypothetical protein TanjilG_05485 [Lupinus angustifolius]|uniref:FLZ-type domain-containing protein n=1 Tax=Lupinus angustifolius TaxID=3871 RepID=A0A4P1QSU6_LUPAN|nr:PREDICTED: uncharacterized protein LOC109331618 [Lupinus angustifolius]OIV94105.1 hypothetical protein TanjilG_05485 [Lupinus angustifolius]
MYSTDSSTSVRPCYLEKNHGLASLKDMDSVHCGNNSFVSRSMMPMTMGYAAASSYVSSPRSGRRFYDARFEDHKPHFLQACFLCKKTLGNNSDIFMYRGDTPFCSEECRAEQIDIDEAKEKKKKLSSSMKVMRNKEQRKSGSPNKAQGYSFRTGAVAA